MLIPRETLRNSVLEDHIIGASRWSIHHEIIFKLDSKYYQATYQFGATEMQDESPWEYESQVKCEEVKQVEKIMKV